MKNKIVDKMTLKDKIRMSRGIRKGVKRFEEDINYLLHMVTGLLDHNRIFRERLEQEGIERIGEDDEIDFQEEREAEERIRQKVEEIKLGYGKSEMLGQADKAVADSIQAEQDDADEEEG